MGRYFDYIKRFIVFTTVIFSILFLTIVLIINFTHTTLTFSSWYPLIFKHSFIRILFYILLSFALLISIFTFSKKLPKKLVLPTIVIINIVSLLIRFFIVLSFSNAPIADSWDIFSGAIRILLYGDISQLYIGNYFAMYPQQLGMVTLLSPLVRVFHDNVNYYYFFNSVLMQLTILLLIQVSMKLKGIRIALVTTIFLNLFIPNLFASFLIYGDIFSLFFLVASYSLYVNYKNTENKYTKLFVYFLMFLLFGLAYLARVSTIVYVIAVLICVFLYKRFKLRFIPLSILSILLLMIIYPINTSLFNKQDVNLGQYEFPSNTWYRLGVSYSWFDRVTPGFHDQRIDWDFKSVSYDKEKMNEINNRVIKERLNQLFKTNEWINFYKKKTIISWTDPDFELMTYILPFSGEHLENPSELQRIKNFGSGSLNLKTKNSFGQWIQVNYDCIRTFEKGFYIMILSVGLISFIKNNNNKEKMFMRLLFVGFLLLHLLIEIKSRYMYVFMNTFIYYCSFHLLDIEEQFNKLVRRFIRKREKE